MLPRYIWYLGIGGQYHCPWPWSILVYIEPSVGVCTTWIFQSLDKWQNSLVQSGWWPLLCYYLCAPSPCLSGAPLCLWVLGLEFFWAVEFFSHDWSWYCAPLCIFPCYFICVMVVTWKGFHCRGACLVVRPLCHLGWCGVLFGLVSFLRTLVSLIFWSYLSPSSVALCPAVLLWWVDVSPPPSIWWFLFIFHPQEVAQGWGGVGLLVSQLCWRWPLISTVLQSFFSKVWGWVCRGWVLEHLCEVRCCVCHSICWVQAWGLILLWEELRCDWDMFWRCLECVWCDTAIMAHQWMDITSFLSHVYTMCSCCVFFLVIVYWCLGETSVFCWNQSFCSDLCMLRYCGWVLRGR